MVHTVQKGYRNESYAATLADGQKVNLIIYKREPDILTKIQNANCVSNFLAAQGMPVRHTVNERIVRLGKGTTAKYAALYNYLPGQTIPWEAYTMEHIKQLGAAMSNMHAALQGLPQNGLSFVIDECRALLKRMDKYFADDGVHDALADKLGLAILDTTRLRPALTIAIDLPAQALHMDFVRGNILFDDQANITGILDFEKTAWGPVIFDIARTLAFLLVDCKYKQEPKIRKYFLHSGYNKRGKNSFEPSPLLEDLLDFFLLHDFYKFLRHNPYESLNENQHFVRTRDFLLKRNILAQTEMLQ
jgi:Ser/Thr protein kinase RdoA (MazF antagonist)